MKKHHLGRAGRLFIAATRVWSARARTAGKSLCLFILISLTVFAFPTQAGLLPEFTIKDEAELGREFNSLIKSRLPIIEDPEIVGYVRSLVDDLSEAMGPIPFDIKVSVLNNNGVNAFAGPAGYMFVFNGLILNMETESELAGVIAHEMAHVSQRHIAKNIERSQIINLATLTGVLAGVLLGSDGGDALVAGSLAAGQSSYLKYSRDDEREADQVGLNYLVDAGFNPNGMVSAFEKIRKLSWMSSGSIPAYLSTHPGVDERIGYLTDRLARLPDDVVTRTRDNQRFLRVQTLLRAKYSDPKQALAHFNKREPSCLDYLGQGIALERLNRVNEARAAFERAEACNRGDPLFLREIGRFYFLVGDFNKAGRYLQQAAMQNSDDLIALFYLGRMFDEQGQTEQAARYMQRILRYLPEDGEVHYYLGRIKGKTGEYFEAHMHLAYGAIYSLDKKQAKFHMDKAQSLANDQDKKKEYEKLQSVYKERSQYW